MILLNEFDQFAAEWLSALIEAGELPEGVVDTRSIHELNGTDFDAYSQVHLFAGIGGWPLALQLAGWPANRRVGTGSCPCQPFSEAGLQAGEEDPRHLWPEMFRVVRQSGIDVWFIEQVASAVRHGWLDGVFADMEGEGYAGGAIVLGAHSVGAPHIRQRIWGVFVRVAKSSGAERRGGTEPSGEHGRTFHPTDSGSVGGLAHDINQRRQGIEATAIKRGSGLSVQTESSGCLDRLGDTNIDGQQPGWASAATNGHRGSTDAASGSVRLEHATGDGREQRRSESGGRGLVGGCGTSWRMGSPIRQGLEGFSGDGGNGDQPGRNDADTTGPVATTGNTDPWSRFDLIPCRDGKARRVPPLSESGLFPLAYGFPRELGRVRSILEGMGFSAKAIQRMLRRPRSLLAMAGRNRVGRLKGFGNAIVVENAVRFIRAAMEEGV